MPPPPKKKFKKDYRCDLCATDPFVTPILAINTIVPAVTNKKNKNGNNGSALLTLLLPWWGHGGAESICCLPAGGCSPPNIHTTFYLHLRHTSSHLEKHTGNSKQEIRTQNCCEPLHHCCLQWSVLPINLSFWATITSLDVGKLQLLLQPSTFNDSGSVSYTAKCIMLICLAPNLCK